MFTLNNYYKTASSNSLLLDQGIISNPTIFQLELAPSICIANIYVTLRARPLSCQCEMIYLARGLINLFSTISLLSHSTAACLVSALAVVMAPHGAPGAKRVSTDLQLEAKSEKRVLRIKHSQSSTSRAPVAEGTVEFPGVHRAQCSENSPNSQSARTDKKSSAPPVFPRSQIFLFVLCLLFHHTHAGRILMYLPVATRYDSYINFNQFSHS